MPLPDPTFTVNRTDVIRSQVQQAIRPEAVALSVFGVIAALAMLVLVGQGLAQMITRSAPDTAVLRVLGATRAQAALGAALPGLVAVLAGVALAVAGAVAVSPLAPVGPVRQFAPDHGIASGRLAWHAFAGSLGIVPIVEVPVAALILGLVALVLAGNLLASLPAAVAARTRPGVSLRAE